ncbi:MAG: flagellar biosynthetic protein FliR [Nitrospiraceae bacterium]
MTQVVHLAIPQFQVFLVIVIRVSGIISVWPVLASRTIPLQIKTGLVLMLGFVLLPLVRVPAMPTDAWPMAHGLAGEFLMGMVLGLAVRLVFSGIELAGELIGIQMGIGSVQLLDPTTFQQAPLIGHFQTLLASLVFLSLNAHLVVVQAIARSFDLVPPFGAMVSSGLLQDVLFITQGAFVLAIQLAAPVLVTVLLINLSLAILGRAVVQMNVFVLSFPITIAAGFLVLGATLPFTVSLYASQFDRLVETLQGLMKVLGHG